MECHSIPAAYRADIPVSGALGHPEYRMGLISSEIPHRPAPDVLCIESDAFDHKGGIIPAHS